MNPRNSSRSDIWYGFLGLLLASMLSTAAVAEPSKHGFPPSLHQLNEAAELTASFNVGPRLAVNYPPNLPFQILYAPWDPAEPNNTGGTNSTFYVAPGARLYVRDLQRQLDSIIGDFPPPGSAAVLRASFRGGSGLVYARSHRRSGHCVGPSYVVEVIQCRPMARRSQAVAAVRRR
jgi:hypothetical protein